MSLFLHKKVEAAMAHPNIYYRTFFIVKIGCGSLFGIQYQKYDKV